jgi:colicin import membrane protein
MSIAEGPSDTMDYSKLISTMRGFGPRGRLKGRAALLFPAITLLALSGAAFAGEGDDRLRENLRMLQKRVMSAEAELGEASQQNQALKQQLDDEKAHSEALRQKAEQATGENHDLQQKLAELQARLQQAGAQQDQEREMLQKWQTTYNDLLDKAKKIDTDRREFGQRTKILEVKAEAAQKEIAACTEKNAKLYKIGTELIELYKNKGVTDVMQDNEPFLQLSRVDMQNLMQDYSDKLYDQKVGVQPAPPPAGAAAASAQGAAKPAK